MNQGFAAEGNLGSVPKLSAMMRVAVQNAARGLTAMVGRYIVPEDSKATMIRFDQVVAHFGDPETEAVGIYLLMQGALSGQIVLIMPLPSALNLADLLMGAPLGTTTALDELERSALAEVGNLAACYFLNAMASLTGKLLQPSPPAVMVDMLGAILNVIVTPVAAVSDDLLIIETVLRDAADSVVARFWVLPDWRGWQGA